MGSFGLGVRYRMYAANPTTESNATHTKAASIKKLSSLDMRLATLPLFDYLRAGWSIRYLPDTERTFPARFGLPPSLETGMRPKPCYDIPFRATNGFPYRI